MYSSLLRITWAYSDGASSLMSSQTCSHGLKATGLRSVPFVLNSENVRPFKNATDTSRDASTHLRWTATWHTILCEIRLAVGDAFDSSGPMGSANPFKHSLDFAISSPDLSFHVSTHLDGIAFSPVRFSHTRRSSAFPVLFSIHDLSSFFRASRISEARVRSSSEVTARVARSTGYAERQSSLSTIHVSCMYSRLSESESASFSNLLQCSWNAWRSRCPRDSFKVWSDLRNIASSSEADGVSKSDSRRLDSDILSNSTTGAISSVVLKRTLPGPKSSVSSVNLDFWSMSENVSPPVGCDSNRAITWWCLSFVDSIPCCRQSTFLAWHDSTIGLVVSPVQLMTWLFFTPFIRGNASRPTLMMIPW